MTDEFLEGRYERHLREMFDGFGGAGDGRLNRDETGMLCDALRIPGPLRDRLLPKGADRLDFSRFRANLLALLTGESDALSEHEPEQETEAAPASPDGLEDLLERTRAERDKLKADLASANERADRLASEVDERHAELEAATERRMAEAAKKFAAQLDAERRRLELELKTALDSEACANDRLEEARSQLRDLERKNLEMSERIRRISADSHEERPEPSIRSLGPPAVEPPAERDEPDAKIVELEKTAASLKAENDRLRDRNDELCAELEADTARHRTPLREDSPKKRAAPSSPQLPPIDILHQDRTTLGQIMRLSQTIYEGDDDEESTDTLENVVRYFKDENCIRLSKILAQSSYKHYYLLYYFSLCRLMELADSEGERDEEDVKTTLRICADEVTRSRLDRFVDAVLMIGGDDEDETDKTKKINELEYEMESLRCMYDECEDYWTTKIKEERDLYEQEQQMNDEKYSALMSKLSEYEEQFASKEDSQSKQLPVIEERYDLEQQYAHLEREFETHRSQSESLVLAKDEEIRSLKEQIRLISCRSKSPENVSPEDNTVIDDKEPDPKLEGNERLSNLNGFDPFHTDEIPTIASPIEYLWSQKTISSPVVGYKPATVKTRDYQNPLFSKEQNFNNGNVKTSADIFTENIHYNVAPIQKPDSAKSSSCQNFNSDAFVKNIEPRIESKILHCSELEETLQGRRKATNQPDLNQNHLNSEIKRGTRFNLEQENINLRAVMLDIRCRQLQATLRQHQTYSEAVLQQTLAAHRSEIGALRQKLAAADLLIRDLYVENCHLTGTIMNPSM